MTEMFFSTFSEFELLSVSRHPGLLFVRVSSFTHQDYPSNEIMGIIQKQSFLIHSFHAEYVMATLRSKPLKNKAVANHIT